MADSQVITVEGNVVESLPNALFRVRIDGERTILAHVSGKMRLNHIRLLPGDKVRCEVSASESSLTRGRIVYKL